MATAPINTFKSVALELEIDEQILYTAPADTTAIILLAQAANITTAHSPESANVTFRTSLNNTELVKDFTIPPGDAASLLVGKLVLEPNQYIEASADANNSIKVTISILETR